MNQETKPAEPTVYLCGRCGLPTKPIWVGAGDSMPAEERAKGIQQKSLCCLEPLTIPQSIPQKER